MIIGVRLQNVKNHPDTHIALGALTNIKGATGYGKTAVADGICFAFTGRDSSGAMAPTHLIKDGGDKLQVTVETEKAFISRTLSRKKNSTIKFTPKSSNIPVSFTQAQMEERMGCSADVFLSAAICGYFFSLSKDKRMDVLRSVFPAVDRHQILMRILGWESIPEGFEVYLHPTKRADLEATKVAEARRNVEREHDVALGKLQQLSEAHGSARARPELRQDILDHHKTLTEQMKAWQEYESKLRYYEDSVRKAGEVDRRLVEWEEKRKMLVAELNAVPPPEQFDAAAFIQLGQEIADLNGTVKPTPQEPQSLKVPDGERCMTCGQVIGVKHREECAASSQKMRESWISECRAVEEHNAEISRRLEPLLAKRKLVDSEHKEMLKRNDERSAARRLIQRKMDAHEQLRPSKVAVESLPPAEPSFPKPSGEVLQRIEDNIRNISRDIDIWEHMQKLAEKARHDSELLQKRVQSLERSIRPLREIEEAYKRLELEVVRENEAHYQLRDGHRIIANDLTVTVANAEGKLRDYLSSGEKIRAGAYLCEKLVRALHPRVPFVFVDNVDLVTGGAVSIEVPQVIYAHVTDGDFCVEFDR